jgi:hypothetical protein
MTCETVRHEFVEFIPDVLEEGVVYVSIAYATASHKCCCGCGKEVVTPLSPTDWKLIFDGKTISLDPSIGNWGFECRSHYWIQRNRVNWARSWSEEQVIAGRAHDSLAKERYFGAEPKGPSKHLAPTDAGQSKSTTPQKGLWQGLRKLFRRK